MMCPVVFCSAVCVNILHCDPWHWALVVQAEKVLLFSPDTNLTSLLLEAKDLEARVIILSARCVPPLSSGSYICVDVIALAAGFLPGPTEW